MSRQMQKNAGGKWAEVDCDSRTRSPQHFMSLWDTLNHEKILYVCYFALQLNDGSRPYLCDATSSNHSMAWTSLRTQDCCLPIRDEHAKQIDYLPMSSTVERLASEPQKRR